MPKAFLACLVLFCHLIFKRLKCWWEVQDVDGTRETVVLNWGWFLLSLPPGM